MGPHDNQIAVLFFGDIQDHFHRVSLFHYDVVGLNSILTAGSSMTPPD